MKYLALLIPAFSAHLIAVEPLTDAEKKRLVVSWKPTRVIDHPFG